MGIVVAVLTVLVSAAVSLIVTRLTVTAAASRELAADIRLRQHARAERLRVAYSAAVRLAKTYEQASDAHAFSNPDESLTDRLARFAARLDPPLAAYSDRSAELLLDHEGTAVDELIEKMRRAYTFIAIPPPATTTTPAASTGTSSGKSSRKSPDGATSCSTSAATASAASTSHPHRAGGGPPEPLHHDPRVGRNFSPRQRLRPDDSGAQGAVGHVP